jgi:hypothetical protein
MFGDSLGIMLLDLFLKDPEEQKNFRIEISRTYIVISKLIAYTANIFLLNI